MKNDDLLKLFQQQLDELVVGEASFKVALSGGLDSVVLLHLFSRLKKSAVTAHHIHHGLSENADNWARFCQQLATQLALKCCVTEVVLDKKSRTSLEAVAREKRYAVLQKGLTENSYLVTAHHQDDQLETVLLALKRGAGLTGLQGIVGKQPLATGYLIRPLLMFSRAQLEAYAHAFKLKWIEDESNADQRFDRNFIRHTITPLLKERWPAITSTVARSASHCQSQQSLIDEITGSDFEHCLLEPLVLKIEALKGLTEARRNNVLRRWFKTSHLNYPSSKQLVAIWENIALAQEDALPQLPLQGHSVCRYRDALYLFDKSEYITELVCIDWQGEAQVSLLAGKVQFTIEMKDKQLLASHQVQFCFRNQLPTDLKCQPVGRSKRRTIKKLLHEYHVPPWLRDYVPFIMIDGVVVEAVGLFKCDCAFSKWLSVTLI